jgi:hypothetical protein
MNKAIKNLVEIELRLVNLRIFGISSMAVLKTIIGGVPVKKSIVKYDPKIFVLYRSALVEHMKGVKGRPPVMLFVAVAVALFSIFQLGSYFKAHGGIIPKPPNLQKSDQKPQAQERKSNYSFFPSSSASPSFSSPSPPPATPSYPPSTPSRSTSYPSEETAKPPSGSGSGSGYIIIGNPSLPETPHRGDFELPSPKVKVIE